MKQQIKIILAFYKFLPHGLLIVAKASINKSTNNQMSDISKIKDKLAKLLRLSDASSNASEGEIKNALSMASQLMAKHNLTREDIDMNSDNPTAKISYNKNEVFSSRAKYLWWENEVVRFICDFIPSVGYYQQGKKVVRKGGMVEMKGSEPRKGFSWVFYGSDEDVEAAVDLFYELQTAIQVMATIRWGSFSTGDGLEYSEGFIIGVEDANIEQLKALESSDGKTYELMVQSSELGQVIVDGGKDWLKTEHGIQLKSTRGRSSCGTGNGAGSEGRSDGSKYNVNKPSGTKKLN